MSYISFFTSGILALLFGACTYPAVAPYEPPVHQAVKWDTLTTVWRMPKPFNAGQAPFSCLRPALLNDSVAVFGYGEGFVCINIISGRQLWKSTLDLFPGGYAKDWVAEEMIVESNRIYALAGYAAVNGARASAVCVSALDGSILWRHDLDAGAAFAWRFSRYSASEDAIFFATQDSHVFCLDKASGKVRWESPNGAVNAPVSVGIWQGAPVFRNGVVYVCAGINPVTPGMGVDGSVVALDAKTGELLWSRILPRADSTSGYTDWQTLNDNRLRAQPVPTPEGLIIEPGFCIALMDTTGRLVWERAPSVNGGLSIYAWAPIYQSGILYGVNSGNGNYFSFSMDARTGAVNWIKAPFTGPSSNVYRPPQIANQEIYQLLDQNEAEITGQDLNSGERRLLTPLTYYLEKSTDVDGVSGTYLVHDNRIVFMTDSTFVCIQGK